jgi:transcriptional regulator with XRE-family HTH domain
MVYDDEKLYYQEEKLKYVIKTLHLTTKEVAKELEISQGMVSQILNYRNNRLRRIHLHAICHAYSIPIEIFENREVNSTELIDQMLKESQNGSMFRKDYELLDKLLGKWYLYSYPSNPNLSEVWATETYFYEDFSVEDMHQNRGKLLIGKNQSIIIKESHNSHNLTSITFDNEKVTYKNFAFSRVSKSNSLNQELFNFGFFSRKKMETEEAKEILGEIKKVQLHMDYEMLKRISCCIEIKG